MSKLYKVTIDESFSSGKKDSYYTKELEETNKALEIKGYASVPLDDDIKNQWAYFRDTEIMWGFDIVTIEEKVVDDSPNAY
ncbi:hypothetical protein Q5427_11050 [Brochothrix thermosphacta]|uniref:hypothetical protein n=1 Tax=Brochothrix thermosphacta TaxID=2756 RepID=UPI0027132A7C|nr:hypothetical protein [Brochothrix thermosphacta]MDO7864826.1 hypothetical protein [Brochothrix thermosphacta]